MLSRSMNCESGYSFDLGNKLKVVIFEKYLKLGRAWSGSCYA